MRQAYDYDQGGDEKRNDWANRDQWRDRDPWLLALWVWMLPLVVLSQFVAYAWERRAVFPPTPLAESCAAVAALLSVLIVYGRALWQWLQGHRSPQSVALDRKIEQLTARTAESRWQRLEAEARLKETPTPLAEPQEFEKYPQDVSQNGHAEEGPTMNGSSSSPNGVAASFGPRYRINDTEEEPEADIPRVAHHLL